MGLISTSRNSFRLKISDDETILPDQLDYVWEPEWSHLLFIYITTNTANAAIATVSVHKIYLTVTPLTINATPLNYDTMFKDRTGNNSLNSTFLKTQATLY